MPIVHLAVNGTLMRGLELNANLLAAGATFERDALTEPSYRWNHWGEHCLALSGTLRRGA